MSGGRHHAWRRIAAGMAVGEMPGPALDVATGTGDFTLDLLRHFQVTNVVGLDFTRRCSRWPSRRPKIAVQASGTEFVAGDAHALPFPDDSFICATVGFGVRNFIDVPLALREMRRVVRPGGRVVILEIVRQDGINPIGKVFPLYFRHVTPWMGALFAGDREAYTYLPESVQGFLSADELSELMRGAGLVNVHYRRLALGTVAIHVGEKAGGRK